MPIPSFVPMLMFAIVFGLSMDYEVFLLSRVHEAYLATGDATARSRSASAAPPGSSPPRRRSWSPSSPASSLDADPTIKMLAVGMAGRVLIDASIVRMILVPAVMSLLGDAAWWLPRWLDRIMPDLQLEGPIEEPNPHRA